VARLSRQQSRFIVDWVLESVYESALAIELDLRGIRYERQKSITIQYRGHAVGEHRLDLLVERILVVELKAVKSLEDIFFATTRSYMKAIGVDDGLLLNFASMPLTVKRVGPGTVNRPNTRRSGRIWKSGTQANR
jgi:GxxExxY protein